MLTVGFCWSCILYIVEYIFNPTLLIYPSPSFPFGNHSLFYISMGLFLFCISIHLYLFLDFPYKHYHTILFVFVCLSSPSMVISRSIQVAANDIISFLWLSSIPLYVYTTSSLSIHLLLNI